MKKPKNYVNDASILLKIAQDSVNSVDERKSKMLDRMHEKQQYLQIKEQEKQQKKSSKRQKLEEYKVKVKDQQKQQNRQRRLKKRSKDSHHGDSGSAQRGSLQNKKKVKFNV
ncbi:hypothetical protein MP228_006238 [Amoeboaphelidium protococcarum]|nr:hypothetical protein MP228_006238 [Amoeboaphelidium protococcarum]